MAKSIWVICKYASPEKYFFGTRHFYLAEEWVKKGHEVTIFTSNSSHLTDKLPKFKGTRMVEEIKGVRTVWLKVHKSFKSSSVARVLSWLHFEWQVLITSKNHSKRPDIIIASSLSILSIISGYLLSRFYKAHFILEIRDIWPLSAIQLGGYSSNHPFMWLLGKLEKFGYQKADVIVGTMPNLEEHVNSITSSYNKCICIPQGLSVSFYSKDQVDVSEIYVKEHIPKNKFIVCYTGTLNRNNPLFSLIGAARILKEKTNVHFLILGKGDQKEQLIIDSMDLDNVTFPPPINKNQVNSFLKNCHVCYDSFDSDLSKFGISRNKWIDYMYAAKPIICSYDGFKSIINESNCGDFINFHDCKQLADKIIEYANLPKFELDSIGLNGQRFLLKERTFDVLAEKYLNEID